MELIAIDDFILGDYDIPPAMITNQSSHLGFGVDRRSGIYGSVYFGSTSQPASWHVIIQCPGELSRNALTAVLAAPRNEQVRLLVQRERNFVDLVTTEAAITSVEAHGSSDNIEVTFESNDSVWLAEDFSTPLVTKTFTSEEDQTIHLAVGGNIPTNPLIRIRNLAQRTTQTANVGWKWRQRWKITNGSDEPLFRYPVQILIGSTTGLVSGGKAQGSGNDVRLWLDGLEQPRHLYNWNTSSTAIWVVVPSIPAGGSITYDLVYGNPSAAPPQNLAYPDLPAFDMNPADSSNTRWAYRTANQVNNAGLGLWSLSSPLEGGSADYSVPGAWRPELTFENPNNTDNVLQSRSYKWTNGTNTWYQSSINAARWKGLGFGTLDSYAGSDPFDGVVIHNPFGISSVQLVSYEWSNYAFAMQAVTTTVGNQTTSSDVQVAATPTTRLVVIARDSGGESWHVIAEYGGSTGGTVNVGSTTWTPPGPVKHFGIAVWPANGPQIPDDYEAGLRIRSTGDMYVNLNTSGRLQIVQTQGETAIYELATELRIGGGSNAVGSYYALAIGNSRSASGPGTPRAAIASTTRGLIIDCEQRTHQVWDSTYNSKIEDLPAHAVRALRGYMLDGQNNQQGEIRESRWLPLSPPRRKVVNGDFDVDISSWFSYFIQPGLNAVATYDGAQGGDQLGSIRINVTTNTAPIGAATWLNSQFFSVSGQNSIQVSGWVRTSNTNVQPLLYILWYKDEATAVVSDDGPYWTTLPVANTGYTRSLSAAVPPGMKLFRLGVRWLTTANNNTGSVWFDDIRLNDNELYVHDTAIGQLLVEPFIRPRWVP